MFTDHNMVVSDKVLNLAYRPLHLEQAGVFNYFSHHNITVPPAQWRALCKQYGVPCLGTFITEREDYSDNMLISKELALLLVGVARKCGFDGYLINIERSVKAVSAFKQWLQYFALKMHELIPNSLLVWYDSISAKDGIVRYQNALSR